MTHISTSIFQGFFKNIVFRSVALVTKKLCLVKFSFVLFLHGLDFLPPCTQPYVLNKAKKNIQKNPLNFYGDSVQK